MSKLVVVLDSAIEVIGHVRGIADSLQTVVDVLSEEKKELENSKEIAKIPEKVKTYSFEEVRDILAEKSQAGFSKEVKEIINKYGANRLSDIKPDDYEALIKDAEVIGHE